MPIVRLVLVGIAKTLSKLFGLATMTFFGRMPSRDDDKMALVGLLSLTWLPMVVAVAVPDLVELVPGAPDDEAVRRGLAVTGAVLLPLVNGALISRLHNRDRSLRDTLAQLVAAYPYTAVVGLTVVGIVLVVPVVKAGYLLRRFETEHLLVVVPPDSYDDVVEHVVQLLEQHDAHPRVERVDPIVRGMFAVLARVLGRIFRRSVATEMRVVRGELDDGGWYEIVLHATDITIIGRDRQTSTLLPLLADELDERLLFFTWDDESQRVELEMRRLRDELERGHDVDPDEVADLAVRARGLGLDREEWSALRRNLFRLERDALATALQRARAEAGDRVDGRYSGRSIAGWSRDAGPGW